MSISMALSALGVDLSLIQVAKAIAILLPVATLSGVVMGLRLARPYERAKAAARYRGHRALRNVGAWFDAYVRRPVAWRAAFLQLKAVAFLMRAMRPEFREAVWRWRQCGIPGMEEPEGALAVPGKAEGVAD